MKKSGSMLVIYEAECEWRRAQPFLLGRLAKMWCRVGEEKLGALWTQFNALSVAAQY